MPLRPGLALAAIVALAFLLRLIARLWQGEQAFLEHGYTFYVSTARTFLDGYGLCEEPGMSCGLRVPVYPLLIAPFLHLGWLYPGLVVLQAALGASLSWIAHALGTRLFDRKTAWVAACLTALNPYSVVHDTALQETVVFNVLVAASILSLLRAQETRQAAWPSLTGGVALSLATLTTARLALFPLLAVLWAWFAARNTPGRLRQPLLVALPLILLVGGWTLRNWQVVGSPVLVTESGGSFWIANNDHTLAFLPGRSIDMAAESSMASLPPDRARALEALADDDVARDRLQGRWGFEYVSRHPGPVAFAAARKVWSAASGLLSPARDRTTQLGSAVFFIPIHVLAAIGLVWSRSSVHAPIHLLFAAFAVTTAVFWAHTSHKSVLDVFLFLYAASVVSPRLTGRRT